MCAAKRLENAVFHQRGPRCVEIFVSLRTSLGLLRLAGTLTPASSCSFSSLVSKVRWRVRPGHGVFVSVCAFLVLNFRYTPFLSERGVANGLAAR